MGAFDNIPLLSQPQFIPTYAGAPIQELKQTADVLQDRYYRNTAAMDKLDILSSQIKTLDPDQAEKDRMVGDIRNVIKEIANSGGAYENSTAQIRELARRFYTDPRKMAAEENYQSAMAHLANEKERYQKGDISKFQYDHARRQISEYSGLGDSKDPTEWASPALFSGAKDPDLSKKVMDFMSQYELSLGDKLITDPNMPGYFITERSGMISAEQLYKDAMHYLGNDPAASSYIQDMVTIMGPEAAQNELSTMIAAHASANQKSDYQLKLTADQVYMKEYGHALENKFNKDLGYPIATVTPGIAIESSRQMNFDLRSKEENIANLELQLENKTPGTAQYNDLKERIETAKHVYNENKSLDDKLTQEAMQALNITEQELNAPAQGWRAGAQAVLGDFSDRMFAKNDAWARIEDYKDKRFEKMSEPNEVMMTNYVFGDKKSTDYAQNLFTNMTGLPFTEPGQTNKNLNSQMTMETIENNNISLTWLDTDRDRKQLDDDDLENIGGGKVLGYSIDPATGRQIFNVAMYNGEGEQVGTAAMGTPEGYFEQRILSGNNEANAFLIRQQVHAARMNSSEPHKVYATEGGKLVPIFIKYDKEEGKFDVEFTVRGKKVTDVVGSANEVERIVNGGYAQLAKQQYPEFRK